MLKTLQCGSLAGHLVQQIPALGLDLTPAEDQCNSIAITGDTQVWSRIFSHTLSGEE